MADFGEQMAKLSDERLWEIVQGDEEDFRPEARAAARVELESRGLDVDLPVDLEAMDAAPPTNLLERLSASFQPDQSVLREVLSAGCLGFAVNSLDQWVIELVYHVLTVRESWGVFGSGESLLSGSLIPGLVVGLAALALGILLWRRWRRSLGLLLVGLSTIFLSWEIGSLRITLVRSLISVTGILIGFWLLRKDRSLLGRKLASDVADAFD